MRHTHWLSAPLLSLALWSCGLEDPLMRMAEQKKAKPFAYTPVFADGRVNRRPPEGTVARERDLEAEALAAPRYSMELLQAGRRRYDIVCATCHGYTGEADSIVATNMALRPPPSFHEPRLREKSDRSFYEAITEGYGVMPPFSEIPTRERWAVVAYVRALQRSQRATLAQAPASVQQQLLSEAPAEKESRP